RRHTRFSRDWSSDVCSSDLDAVCIDRAEGSFPIRVLTQNVGTRRPLGIGSGSLALLAAAPDDEVDNILRRNASRLKDYPNVTDEIGRASCRERVHASVADAA